MHTTEIQDPPPDTPVDLAVYIQTKLKEIHRDLRQLLGGIFVDVDGDIGVSIDDPVSRVEIKEKGSLSTTPAANKTLAALRLSNDDDSVYIAFDSNQIESIGSTLFINYGSTKDMSLVKAGGNVVIGAAIPTTSIKLDVVSTTGAFAPPRMTTAQRDALTGSNGMMIYNTTTNRFEGYENGAWADL